MNRATGLVAKLDYRAGPVFINASSFHASPVLDRKRRTHWDSGTSFKSSPKRFNDYYKRLRRQTLLRDIGVFAEHLFQSWESGREEYNQPLGREHSWFRPGFAGDGRQRDRLRNKSSKNFRRRYEFCTDEDEEDDEFSSIFRSAFTGNPGMFWSFTADGKTRSRNSWSSYSRVKFTYEEEDNSSTSSDEYDKPSQDLSSHRRRALGLKTSGPLELEDVKNAYRACALKWHPDRHQGSSKAMAEEKFKACSAAYQSLCQELTLN